VAALFAAGILSRLEGPVLWCLHRRDLFAPALARVGLHPDRVIYCETWKDAEILPSMEEGLRHPGVAGVVGELNRLPLTPSRRLQLAAETSKVTALVVRRSSASEQEPNAATSRWRVSSMPSGDLGIGMGRGRWQVELLRCRGAEPNSWVVEACDAQVPTWPCDRVRRKNAGAPPRDCPMVTVMQEGNRRQETSMVC
jgi:protein ImuA